MFAVKIEFLGEFEVYRWEDSSVRILIVFDIGLIKFLNLSLEFFVGFVFMKDRMLCDFDKDRFVIKVKIYIYDENLNFIWVDLDSSVKDKVYFIKEFLSDKELCIFLM